MIIGVYVLVLQNQAVFRLMFPNAVSLLWNTLLRSFDRLFIFFLTHWSLEGQLFMFRIRTECQRYEFVVLRNSTVQIMHFHYVTLRNPVVSGCNLRPAGFNKHVRNGVIEKYVLRSTAGGIIWINVGKQQ